MDLFCLSPLVSFIPTSVVWPFTHSIILPLSICAPHPSCTQSSVISSVFHLLFCQFVCSFTPDSSIHRFLHAFVHYFLVHLFVSLCIHPFIHSACTDHLLADGMYWHVWFNVMVQHTSPSSTAKSLGPVKDTFLLQCNTVYDKKNSQITAG